jgi:hypothetical protein
LIGVLLLLGCGARSGFDEGFAPKASGGAAGNSGGAAGNSGGAGSSGGPTCILGARASGASPIIDDMLDGDSNILPSEARNGTWYTDNDNDGYQYPAAGILPMTPRARSQPYQNDHDWVADTQGSAFSHYADSDWGAAIGFYLNSGCPYDASAYQGLEFFGAAVNPLQITLSLITTGTSSAAGTCPAGLQSCAAYQALVSMGSSETQYAVPFARLTAQPGSQPSAFDPSKLIGVSFKVPPQTDFAFYVSLVGFE